MRERTKLGGSCMIIAAVLLIAVAPAAGSVTIGQVADPATTISSCSPNSDWVQPTVVAGNSYVVPGTGTVTSWTMFGGANPADQITMKVWRAVTGQTNTFQAVGHAGPQTITSGGTAGNTFPASVQVQPGDILGFHTGPSFTKCLFAAPGEQYRIFTGNTQDGQSNMFAEPGTTNTRLNVEANFVPDNGFSLTGTRRNKKKGTAILIFALPNPGQLVGAGKGAQVSAAAPGAAGSVPVPNSGPSQLLVKSKGKKKRKLNDTGKVKLNLAVTYTPTGGDPSTQSLKLKLKKKL
jgi:hypothetical protein